MWQQSERSDSQIGDNAVSIEVVLVRQINTISCPYRDVQVRVPLPV